MFWSPFQKRALQNQYLSEVEGQIFHLAWHKYCIGMNSAIIAQAVRDARLTE